MTTTFFRRTSASLYFCGIFLSVSFATSLQATETRMETLGAPIGTLDETDVFTFQGRLPDYNLALIELGTAPENETQSNAQAYGGLIKKVGGLTFGVILSRDESLMTDDGAASISMVDQWMQRAAANNDANAILPAPERPIDLFIGSGSPKGRGAWGLRLSYASFKDTTKDTGGGSNTSKKSADQLDLFAGYSAGDANHFDVGVGLGILGTLKQSSDNGTVEDHDTFKRGLELSVAGRYLKSQTGGRSAVQLQFVSRSPKVESQRGTTSESGKFDEKAILLTSGYTLLPGKDVEVSADASYLFLDSKGPVIAAGTGAGQTVAASSSLLSSPDDQIKRTTNALLTNMAVEVPISSGFGILGSMHYTIWGTIKTKDDISSSKSEETITQTSDIDLWSLGAFYQVDALRVDASYKKNFLHSGPYLISGDATTDPLVRISASYRL
jgi:hypothetical protein